MVIRKQIVSWKKRVLIDWWNLLNAVLWNRKKLKEEHKLELYVRSQNAEKYF